VSVVKLARIAVLLLCMAPGLRPAIAMQEGPCSGPQPSYPDELFAGAFGGASTSDSLVYVGLGSDFVVVDMNMSTSPTVLGRATICAPFIQQVQIVQGRAYVSTYFGVHILDVRDPRDPRELGFFPSRPSPSFLVDGDYLYVSQNTVPITLRVVNVADASNPRAVGSFMPDRAVLAISAIQIAGGFAYLGHSEGLTVLDVSKPSRPLSVGSYSWPDPSTPSHLVVDGNTLYAAAGFGRVRIYDVTDQTHLVLRGEWAEPMLLASSGARQSLLYLGGMIDRETAGLLIIDATNPAEPIRADSVPDLFAFNVVGERMIVHEGLRDGRLRVYDISDSRRRREIGTIASTDIGPR
jgi:hypothetical protein